MDKKVGPNAIDTNIGKTVGNFVIKSFLSRGEFSRVYKGVNIKDGTHVAIKIVKKNVVPKFDLLYKDLCLEVGLMKKFKHQNIIGFKDFLESSSNVYIVIQFCKNGDLEQWL